MMYMYTCMVISCTLLVESHNQHDFDYSMIPESACYSLYIVPLIFLSFDWKFKLRALTGLLSVLNIYYFLMGEKLFINVVMFIIKHTVFNIIRYVIYYSYLLHHMTNIEQGEKNLGYYALVSNMNHVIEQKGGLLINHIFTDYTWVPMTACVFMFIATLFACRIHKTYNPIKHQIYSHKKKFKRSLLTSFCMLCCTLSTLVITDISHNTDDEVIEYDFMVMFMMLIVVFINRTLYTYAPYIVYTLICPSIIICTSSIYVAEGDFYSKTIYALASTTQYVLYDAIRFVMYIIHQTEAIDYYIACDLMSILAAETVVCLVDLANFVPLILGSLWILCTPKIIKYHRKDLESARCCELLTSNSV